eukprot:Platyproteum_vivax@DN7760_c0_g1_i1.p1
MAKEVGLKHEILDVDQIEALKMGAYLGVAKGSLYPPKFIHLQYVPQGQVNKTVVLIGKGITFDSGGYNLKVNAMIEYMKIDMGGAAAVLGAAKTIGLLKPEGVHVHFIVAACENMIADKAYRPGDILTASNGKTIEVGNTDAEGRLTLADALVYAEKLKPDVIVDIATLTGACMVGLGAKCAALYSPDDPLASVVLDSAKDAGELLWRMPLLEQYRPDFDSKIADMNNMASTRFGGSIHAALFLKEFVEKTSWAHIDMAGPAWDWKDQCGTGFGARTLVEVVRRISKT